MSLHNNYVFSERFQDCDKIWRGFNPSQYLVFNDIAVDIIESPLFMTVRIMQIIHFKMGFIIIVYIGGHLQ